MRFCGELEAGGAVVVFLRHLACLVLRGSGALTRNQGCCFPISGPYCWSHVRAWCCPKTLSRLHGQSQPVSRCRPDVLKRVEAIQAVQDHVPCARPVALGSRTCWPADDCSWNCRFDCVWNLRGGMWSHSHSDAATLTEGNQ